MVPKQLEKLRKFLWKNASYFPYIDQFFDKIIVHIASMNQYPLTGLSLKAGNWLKKLATLRSELSTLEGKWVK